MSSLLDPGYFSTEELRQMGFAKVGEDVKIAKDATVVGCENIEIAGHVRVDGNTHLIARRGFLLVGAYVHIGAGAHLACAGGICLRDFVNLSQGVRIYSTSDDYSGESLTSPQVPSDLTCPTVAPVTLERHVIIGSGTVILPGVVLGDGVAVGALSLVNKPLDAWGIYAGVPEVWRKARQKTLLALEEQIGA